MPGCLTHLSYSIGRDTINITQRAAWCQRPRWPRVPSAWIPTAGSESDHAHDYMEAQIHVCRKGAGRPTSTSVSGFPGRKSWENGWASTLYRIFEFCQKFTLFVHDFYF